MPSMIRRILVVIAALVLVSPISASAYSAKTETADEEYVTKRAAEAAAQAQAEARQKEEEQTKNAAGANKPQEEQEQPTSGGSSGGEHNVSCVVPSLMWDSLKKARTVLREHHCQVGKVSKLHSRRHGTLVITGQGTPAGKMLPAEARIEVTLGPKAVRGHQSRRLN